MAIYLVGGGPESCPTPGLLDGFRDEVAARGGPLVVVMVERDRLLEEFLPRYAPLAADGVEVRPVVIGADSAIDAAVLDGAGGIVGRRRSHAALPRRAPRRRRRWCVRRSPPARRTPASRRGPWSRGSCPCSGDTSSVRWRWCTRTAPRACPRSPSSRAWAWCPFTSDVHAAQAGTLSRAVAIVDNGLVPRSVAIDEDTVLVVDDGLRVLGTGSVWFSEQDAGTVRLTRRSAGAVDLPGW